MNQTLNFQHQKVTGVSETVNSTNTGDTALVGLSLLWNKADKWGQASGESSPTSTEFRQWHTRTHSSTSQRCKHQARNTTELPGAPSFHFRIRNSTGEQEIFRTYVAVPIHTHNFIHFMFTGAVWWGGEGRDAEVDSGAGSNPCSVEKWDYTAFRWYSGGATS